MWFLRFAMRQSLLMRLTLLLLLPAAGIAVVAQGFSLGEWCLAVFLLGLLLSYDRWGRRAPGDVHHDHVETLRNHSGRARQSGAD